VIPKIRRGSRTYGLLNYLFGPGKNEEHTDAHLVGSWDDMAPDPGRDTSDDPAVTLSRLAAALDLRVKQAGTAAPARHVWHCSVRTAPGDRTLSDAEWDTVARRILHAVNLAPDNDPDGCRWVAVRHAEDHIHILATTVRGDLRRPRMNNDFTKAQAECRRMEKEFGFRRLNAGDGTAAKNPTSAERFKAERTGRTDTAREALRDAVRQALAGAATEAEFLTRVHEAGLLLQTPRFPSGDLRGYKVALPDDRNAAGQPIYYSGSTLAPDLSLPKIRQRLAAATPDRQHTDENRQDDQRLWSPPARSRRSATAAVEDALALLDEGADEAAAHLPAVGEVLDALAQTSPSLTRKELAAAARTFERATRSHTRAEQADMRAVRGAARAIVQAGSALGRGEDGGATAMILSTLVLAALAAARWHAARGHAQQAAAARQSAQHLRTAYQQAAATPMQALRHHGRALPEGRRTFYDTAIRTALTGNNLPTTTAARFDALAATLAQAEQAGHDPDTLLQQAIDQRELDTAVDIDDVLVWRIRRIAHLPAHPGPAARPTTTRTPAPGRQAQRPTQLPASRPSPADPSRRGPRR